MTEPTTQQQRWSSGQAYPLLPLLRLRAVRTELATQVLQSSGETKAAAAPPALRRRAGWTEPTTQQQRGSCQQAGDGAAALSGRDSTGPATARRPASGGVGRANHMSGAEQRCDGSDGGLHCGRRAEGQPRSGDGRAAAEQLHFFVYGGGRGGPSQPHSSRGAEAISGRGSSGSCSPAKCPDSAGRGLAPLAPRPRWSRCGWQGRLSGTLAACHGLAWPSGPGAEQRPTEARKEDIRFATANVLTLRPSEEREARRRQLANTFGEWELKAIGLQEARGRAAVIRETGEYLMIAAAATPGGDLGCELWLHRSFCKKAADMQVLVSELHPRTEQLLGHTTPADMDDWWTVSTDLCHRYAGSTHLVVLTDTNGRVGTELSPAVGPSPSKRTSRGPCSDSAVSPWSSPCQLAPASQSTETGGHSSPRAAAGRDWTTSRMADRGDENGGAATEHPRHRRPPRPSGRHSRGHDAKQRKY